MVLARPVDAALAALAPGTGSGCSTRGTRPASATSTSSAAAFEPVAFCPGYLRGLALHGDFAVVGLSKPRRQPHLQRAWRWTRSCERSDAEPRCGLLVIDLRSGDVVHWLRFEGLVEELYDVAVLPGVRRPMALGFKTDEIRRTLSVAPPALL